LADHRRALRANLAGLNAAMICAEVTTHLLQPHDPHEELFGELEAALSLLAGARESAGRILVSYVKATLLAAGYWPGLGECLSCNRPVGDGPMRFSARAGGVLCAAEQGRNCHVENSGTTMAVPGRVLLALERLDPPAGLRERPPERAGDSAALLMAMN